jgi:hypothetical protein
MILTRQIHQLLEMVVVVLCQQPRRPICGSDFSFLGARAAVVPSMSIGVLSPIPPFAAGFTSVTRAFSLVENRPHRVFPVSKLGESAVIPFVSFGDLDNNTFQGLTSLLSVEQEIQYDEHT